MKIEFEGTYDEIRAQVTKLFPEPDAQTEWSPEDFEEVMSLEEWDRPLDGQKPFSLSALDELRKLIRYSESKGMYLKVSDMHIYHIMASMKNILKNNAYAEVAQSKIFQSLAINFVDKMLAEED